MSSERHRPHRHRFPERNQQALWPISEYLYIAAVATTDLFLPIHYSQRFSDITHIVSAAA
ncbi:hypothetical protein KIN20_010401 [Parelaphostrongylus tenuis]|uniref:Uncharacterized protein n=1 Tax=Parelaphostrongylus tenuis TaxID=148309 RepID=A0AAD5MQM2_PARTN|nr:hypothetical protein KIN20_010401 [Parelaphostrongylus tenuis]